MARSKDFDESEVLAKAVKLFWLKGYNGTSMQEMVDALGISRSSLYDTYVDKHTLYLKALEYYQTTSYAQINNILQKTPSARDTLKQLLELIANSLVSDKQHKGCFMLNAEVEIASQDPEVMDRVCKNDRQIENVLYETIKKGQKSGEISSKQDAKMLTRFFVNTIKGIRVSAKSTTDRSFFDGIIQTSLSLLDKDE
jgi:TetR/AcrR family transcriptional regulator, transcriptional repressor for nem operon